MTEFTPTKALVEQVARAVHGARFPLSEWDHISASSQIRRLKEARAALKASPMGDMYEALEGLLNSLNPDSDLSIEAHAVLALEALKLARGES